MKQVHPIDEFIEARKRHDANFNRGKFADLVGADRSTIHRLMTGHPNVSNDLMDKIEAATGISAVVLFTLWHAAKREAARKKPKTESPARARA